MKLTLLYCNSHVSCVVFWDAVFRPLLFWFVLYKYRYDRGEMSLRVTKIIPGTISSVCLIYYQARINNVSLERRGFVGGNKSAAVTANKCKAVTTYHHVNCQY